jgi:uncharacterized membrane protein
MGAFLFLLIYLNSFVVHENVCGFCLVNFILAAIILASSFPLIVHHPFSFPYKKSVN